MTMIGSMYRLRDHINGNCEFEIMESLKKGKTNYTRKPTMIIGVWDSLICFLPVARILINESGFVFFFYVS